LASSLHWLLDGWMEFALPTHWPILWPNSLTHSVSLLFIQGPNSLSTGRRSLASAAGQSLSCKHPAAAVGQPKAHSPLFHFPVSNKRGGYGEYSVEGWRREATELYTALLLVGLLLTHCLAPSPGRRRRRRRKQKRRQNRGRNWAMWPSNGWLGWTAAEKATKIFCSRGWQAGKLIILLADCRLAGT
jgi:hypothetical protein